MTLLYQKLNFCMFFNFSKALIKLVRQYWINYHHIKSTKKVLNYYQVENWKKDCKLLIMNIDHRTMDVTKEINDYQSIKCLTSPSKIPDSL